jgi:ribonuclease D
MPIADLPDPILITGSADLDKMVADLSTNPIVAVDTEANSLYAYRERVCLIQFSTSHGDYLVDPLAVKDLSPLTPFFNSPDIEKVFHAAEYDLIVLQRDFGFTFTNLFDTMLAARILGWEAVGLGSILHSQFKLNLNKRYQRANWGKRPIPSEMLTYAQLDTHYLIPLRGLLKDELIAKGRWELAQEDFRRACQVTIPKNNDHSMDCWRINGARYLKPHQLAVLHELCGYRDRIAKARNLPLFKIIGDKTLLALATAMPRRMTDLNGLQGMSPRQIQRHGKALLSAVRRGLKKNPPPLPQKPHQDEQYLIQVDKLRRWRKVTARRIGVGSEVVLPKDLLCALAGGNPGTKMELAQILATVPWRLATFGDEILDVLSN